MGSDVMNSENAGSTDSGAPEKAPTESHSSAGSAEHSSDMTAAAPAEPAKEEIKAAPETAAPKPEMAATSASVSPGGGDGGIAGEAVKEPSTMNSSAMDAPGKDSPKDAPKDISAEALKPRPGSSLILIPPVTRKSDGPQASAAPKSDTGAASASFASARSARTSRISKGTLLRYGIPAALGFCLFGVGIATGGRFFGGVSSVPAASASAPAASATAANKGVAKVVHTVAVDPQTAELRRLTKKLTEEVHALQARVDSMHANPAASSEDVRSLRKSVEALRASLESTRAETGATIAILSSKVDHLQHETTARAQTPAPNERSARSEKPVAGAPVTTASVTHPGTAPHTTAASPAETAMATPASVKPQTTTATPAAEPKKKPEKLLANWVVRDVYRGIALIDGPEGSLEVTRGDPVPGAGTVESIERRNGGWVLVTSRGVVASARD